MLKPLNDRIIVEPLKSADAARGGIILPDTAEKEKPEKGKVVAVGNGRLLSPCGRCPEGTENGQRAPLSVKVGDTVIFKKYSPDEIKEGDKEYLILSESDILAIID